jgi:hypothetical protein
LKANTFIMENRKSNKFQIPKITFGAGSFSGRYNYIEKDWPLLSVRRAFELGIVLSIIIVNYYYQYIYFYIQMI